MPVLTAIVLRQYFLLLVVVCVAYLLHCGLHCESTISRGSAFAHIEGAHLILRKVGCSMLDQLIGMKLLLLTLLTSSSHSMSTTLKFLPSLISSPVSVTSLESSVARLPPVAAHDILGLQALAEYQSEACLPRPNHEIRTEFS